MATAESRRWSPWRKTEAATTFTWTSRPTLLDDEEKARWHRFPVAVPRCRFALCRAALRIALTERLGCSNHPALLRLWQTLQALRPGWTTVARPGHDLDSIGSMVYGPTERQFLALAEGSRKVHLFYRLWSMKEALIKALGSGFSLNPSGFEVPEPMLRGVRSSVFRFPHEPSTSWCLIDPGEHRFAAAVAYRVSPSAPPVSPRCRPLTA